jgi:membrane associated rhomboid family serine protease
MIPLADETRKPARFATVTALIIAVNVAVFLMELTQGDAFITQWAATPAQISAGQNLITLITSMFLHGSWSHIIGNMVFLWAFGPEIEDRMGPLRYLVFYLLGGVVAMAAQIALDPSSTVTSLGASGAIAAVMGAFLVTYPRDQIKTILFFGFFFQITLIPAVLLIGFWFITQLVSLGVVTNMPHTAGASGGGVAYMAHVGGLIFGALTARLFEHPLRQEGPWT